MENICCHSDLGDPEPVDVFHEVVVGNRCDVALQMWGLQPSRTIGPAGGFRKYPVWQLRLGDFRPREGTCRAHITGKWCSQESVLQVILKRSGL